MNRLPLIKSWSEDCHCIEKYIRKKASDKTPLRILEAGCGPAWAIDLSGIRFTLTGVDLSRELLERRMKQHKDLDEAIVGDLRTVDLKAHSYDVVYSSYVLEHIDGAERVLENVAHWLAPRGLLIVRIPDRNSVWGFVTRLTPHWFHVLHQKRIRRARDSGYMDTGPFPTFHDPVVSRGGIREYCLKNDFVLKEEYGHGYYLEGLGLLGFVIYVLVRCVSAASLGRLAWAHNDLTYILEKA